MNDQDSQIEKQKEQSVIFAQKVEESDYNQNHEESNGFNNTFDSHFVEFFNKRPTPNNNNTNQGQFLTVPNKKNPIKSKEL